MIEGLKENNNIVCVIKKNYHAMYLMSCLLNGFKHYYYFNISVEYYSLELNHCSIILYSEWPDVDEFPLTTALDRRFIFSAVLFHK